jgi:hypothetical protein
MAKYPTLQNRLALHNRPRRVAQLCVANLTERAALVASRLPKRALASAGAGLDLWMERLRHQSDRLTRDGVALAGVDAGWHFGQARLNPPEPQPKNK